MDWLHLPHRGDLRLAHWVAIDAACTALLLLAYGVVFHQVAFVRGIPQWAAAVIAAAAVLPVALRRRWTGEVLAVVVVAGAVLSALSAAPAPPLAAAFVMYLVPLRYPRRVALWLLTGALTGLVAGLVVYAVDRHGIYGTGGAASATRLAVFGALLITGSWVLGLMVRQQRAYADGLAEQAELRASAALALAHRASADERFRIARELHDVVAHSLSLIAVQAGVANYVVSTQPGEAARALTSIEDISRGALQEMRALLGVLRTGDGDAPAAGPDLAGRGPAPGLAGLGSLAEQSAGAGVQVEFAVRGERRSLPAGLDLAAYRVIQEAITNVIKHAGTDSCRVSLDYRQDTLTLEITDSGTGCGESKAAGHGLLGMRERVGMYGGEFTAAALPHGGFRVFASFPFAGAAR
jgi:signal transduction histidine kinase